MSQPSRAMLLSIVSLGMVLVTVKKSNCAGYGLGHNITCFCSV